MEFFEKKSTKLVAQTSTSQFFFEILNVHFNEYPNDSRGKNRVLVQTR